MKIKSLYDLSHTMRYLNRIGAEPRSLLKAVVKEIHGQYWRDIDIISFTKSGEISCKISSHAPKEEEIALIKTEFSQIEWPKPADTANFSLPEQLRDVDENDLFIFKDVNGKFLMLQHKREVKGEKSYFPWTLWDDGEWRATEPDGKLPLFGLENLKDNTTVFLHEGAKAARKIQSLISDESSEDKKRLAAHPWGNELQNACHLGWIGGALSPHRTDFSVLQKNGVKRVYIVSDNDAPGIAACPEIAQQIRCTTYQIRFTNEFPASFDLYDEFPSKFFKSLGDQKYYVGPSFRDCLHPATFMTDLVYIADENGRGKNVPVLRSHARNEWAFVSDINEFVHVEMPRIKHSEDVLNKVLRPFSDTKRISDLIVGAFTGRTPALCYRPDLKGRVVTNKGVASINTYLETSIKPEKGDIEPFMKFMQYLVPDEEERHEVMRWCMTLVGKPERRMLYGLLMISEREGTGKGTLGEKILAPLVGYENATFPSEKDVVKSNYNGWCANKRLAVVPEIYQGHSFQAANNLKTYITDKQININPKYGREYQIDNWIHVYACSNSYKALKLGATDRRWFVPTLTEERWGKKDFDDFYKWLEFGGLNIILWYARTQWNDWVGPAEMSPMSKAKADMIEEGKSEAVWFCESVTQVMDQIEEPVALAWTEIKKFMKASLDDKVFDSDKSLQRAMKSVFFTDARVSVSGRLTKLVLNKPAFERIIGVDSPEEGAKIAKQWLKMPFEILKEDM